MAIGYRVFSGRDSPLAKMILGSIAGEFLFWNEVKASASTVSLQTLLRPKPPHNNLYFDGMLELMPELERHQEKLKKLKNPDPVSRKEWDTRRNFTAGWKLRDTLYRVKLQIKERKCQWTSKGTVMFEYRPLKNDCRVDMDDAQLGGYQWLVQDFKSDFQIPILVALLSTQTNKFYTGSMVSAMERSFGGTMAARRFWFASTGMCCDLRVDVGTFEQLAVQICHALNGETAVQRGGLLGAGCNTIRLDDMDVDTTDDDAGVPHALRIRKDDPAFDALLEESPNGSSTPLISEYKDFTLVIKRKSASTAMPAAPITSVCTPSPGATKRKRVADFDDKQRAFKKYRTAKECKGACVEKTLNASEPTEVLQEPLMVA